MNKSQASKKPLTKDEIAALKPSLICQLIVDKLVKKETVNWPRDIKIAKILVRKFPNPLFWDVFNVAAKLEAMPQLLTPYSLNYISEKYNLFLLDFKPEKAYILSNERVGEDLKLDKKSQTTMEFING